MTTGMTGRIESFLRNEKWPSKSVAFNQTSYDYSTSSIFNCILDFIAINNWFYISDKCYQWSFHTFPRSWVSLPSLMDNQVMFPMFYHEGTLYAAGGLSNEGNIIPNMRFLNSGSLSWNNGGANANSGIYAHCGILHKNRIYTFGGARCDKFNNCSQWLQRNIFYPSFAQSFRLVMRPMRFRPHTI